MRILVVSNIVDGKLNSNIFNLFGAVKKLDLNAKCDVLLIGYNIADSAEILSKYDIVEKILILEDILLKHPLAEMLTPIVVKIVPDYTHVLIVSDSFGKNLLPRVAGVLEIGQISEIVDILSPSIFKKFMYAGNVLIEVESLEYLKLLTVRSSNFEATTTITGLIAPIIKLNYKIENSEKIKFIKENIINNAVDLESAKVIVTGGRSLGTKDSFNFLIRGLANKLSAGVGATRAAVEAGLAPNDCQIGQTGKIVAPDLYLAIGISGAVQHIAGMKDSKTVIAINNDQTAPIFEHADYGLIGDLFTIVPKLLESELICK